MTFHNTTIYSHHNTIDFELDEHSTHMLHYMTLLSTSYHNNPHVCSFWIWLHQLHAYMSNLATQWKSIKIFMHNCKEKIWTTFKNVISVNCHILHVQCSVFKSTSSFVQFWWTSYLLPFGFVINDNDLHLIIFYLNISWKKNKILDNVNN